MRRALELLREGTLPVRDVANSVGYRQPAQFAKTFRRHHGAPAVELPRTVRGRSRAATRSSGLGAARTPDASPSSLPLE